jgi:hypothetical protein
MPQFQFSEYSESELITCGDAFLASCKKIWNMTGSAKWTEHVLDWFCGTAPKGVSTDARTSRTSGSYARKTIGEWLVDLVHTSYPPLDDVKYWNAALKEDNDRAWSILLALESEWGKGRSHSVTRDMVLDDASKLTALRAEVKVLITGTTTKHVGELEQDLHKLRIRTRDLSPWLWINLPNEDTPENCQFVIFGNRHGTVRRCPS